MLELIKFRIIAKVLLSTSSQGAQDISELEICIIMKKFASNSFLYSNFGFISKSNRHNSVRFSVPEIISIIENKVCITDNL